jgi:hypothetical protein
MVPLREPLERSTAIDGKDANLTGLGEFGFVLTPKFGAA